MGSITDYIAVLILVGLLCSPIACGSGRSESEPSPADSPSAPSLTAEKPPSRVSPGQAVDSLPRSGKDNARRVFEENCANCHSLELPKSQRLDRATWEWVVSDMVTKYGAVWITEEQQEIIIDYLVENYGPDRPR